MKIWIIKDISDMWYEARLHVLSFVLDLKEKYQSFWTGNKCSAWTHPCCCTKLNKLSQVLKDGNEDTFLDMLMTSEDSYSHVLTNYDNWL